MTTTLSIELLRTFHAVVRTGKFSAAAKLLHKSPAAVSIHIQRLEVVAGGQLLQRDNQSVMLTALGKKLLRSTAELLRSHDQILADLHGANLTGRIILGMPDEYAAQVIREILPPFSAAWPNVVMELKMGPSNELEEWIDRGKLDAAVVVQPKEKTSPDAQLLMSTTPVWVGPLNNTVALETPLPLAVYAAPCIYRKAITASLKASGRRSRIVLESHSSKAVQACVEAGLAVSLMDRGKVSGHMVILENMPTIPDHNIVFIRSAQSYGDEAVDLLSKALHQSFRL
ncbi:LysR family transcriptional regulator [Pantoea sp. PNT01]|uniref:LysR family transcriptional regulator n=1 Tax=Pantoea eucalypti TaxID=470933 RepID=A0ABY2ZKE8_9GAMM|nr:MULTISPECIES: LysR family transcriptional regulator [Pantoea]PQL27400.1 LysR family transcriptional regulator [Pantoea ananatis]MBD9552968.1 LysR family transcriptional regulator [Pantoea sp. PNT01]MCD2357800.1 LysR family transcriptional regulator [Pantoea sp. MHSD4]QGF28997.1 LysR family transcriptional regulator [Pantoea eucalypti]TPV37134.1 LysR family transcriptional regulator [Pantoea eucalypti]